MRIFAPLLLAVLLAACDALPVPTPETVECTLIGCDSQVIFELADDLVPGTTYELEACIDGRCISAAIELMEHGLSSEGSLALDADSNSAVLILDDGDYDGTHTVSLVLQGGPGERVEVETETKFERLQPNGPRCEPVCWQATVLA